MERDARYATLAAFALVCVAAAFAFIWWYSGRGDQRDYQTYEIYFLGTVSGLSKGSPVRYLGVDVGRVTALGVDKLKIIGVDSDQFESDTANSGVYLTSVLKNMDITTFNAIQAVVDGTFEGGVTVGTLENGGVGLAPFHDLESAVPAELAAQLDEIKAGIIDGSVSVKG